MRNEKNGIKTVFNSKFHKWCYGVKNLSKIVDAVTVHSLQHDVQKLNQECGRLRVQMKMLHDQNVNLQDFIKSQIITPMSGKFNPFEGRTFVVTGALYNSSRVGLNNMIETHGGRIAASVGTSVDVLVHGKQAGSKLITARMKHTDIELWDEARLIDELKKWS